MLLLVQDGAADRMILTLAELKTLTSPYYLFIFTHTLTKTVVKFIKAPADEESLFPERYNKYTINTSVMFLSKPVGEWLYTVYEQASAVNLDPALSTGIVEQGKMQLDRATDFEFDKYNAAVTYKTYNG